MTQRLLCIGRLFRVAFSEAAIMQEYPRVYPCDYRHLLPPVVACSKHEPLACSEGWEEVGRQGVNVQSRAQLQLLVQLWGRVGGTRVGCAKENRYTNRMSEAVDKWC
jgi:hypothetical protein